MDTGLFLVLIFRNIRNDLLGGEEGDFLQMYRVTLRHLCYSYVFSQRFITNFDLRKFWLGNSNCPELTEAV